MCPASPARCWTASICTSVCPAWNTKPCAAGKHLRTALLYAARARQHVRFTGTGISCNAHMPPSMLAEFCTLDDACEKLMQNAFSKLGLTARSHDRILRVARTIADLDGAESIEPAHLAEAIQYRNTDILKG